MRLLLILSLSSRPTLVEKVVPRGGFEPPTPAFSVPCSTKLSYLGLHPDNHILLFAKVSIALKPRNCSD